MSAHVTIEAAEEIVSIQRPSIAKIQAEVALFYGIPALDMVSNRRSADVAFPRQVAMYLARHLTVHSFLRIGNFFGGRDHTTVMHACRLVTERLALEEKLEQDITYLRGRLL